MVCSRSLVLFCFVLCCVVLFLPCSAVSLTPVNRGAAQAGVPAQFSRGGDKYVWDQNHLSQKVLDHRGAGVLWSSHWLVLSCNPFAPIPNS